MITTEDLIDFEDENISHYQELIKKCEANKKRLQDFKYKKFQEKHCKDGSNLISAMYNPKVISHFNQCVDFKINSLKKINNKTYENK